MPFDISGTYVPLAPPVFPATAGTLIRSAYYNAQINDIGSSLTLAYTAGFNLLNATDSTKGATVLGYKHPGTGAVSRNGSLKFQEYLTPADFGADPTGVLDSTVALKAVFDYAIPLKLTVRLRGEYLISGPIQPYVTLGAGELNIEIVGNVKITVSPAAVAFSDVLYFGTSASNNVNIYGGLLTILCNNKAARGLSFRHDSVVAGGDVTVSAKVRVLDCLETVIGATRENAGISSFGLYNTVTIESPYVKNVNRANPTVGAGAGACAGVSVGNCSGIVAVNDPYVENILCGPGMAEDGDGVKIFGADPAVSTEERVGTAVITGGRFINCQGRSVKLRSGSATIRRPRVTRTGAVVVIPQGVEFDFQACTEATLLDPFYEYTGTDTVAPFGPGSSFSCVTFQQTVTNKASIAKAIGGSMLTQVSFARYCLALTASGAQASYAEMSGLTIIPVGLTTSVITRALMETDMALIALKSTKTELVVTGNTVPVSNISALGYVNFTAGILSGKFSFEVSDNKSSLAGTNSRAFAALSGASIGEVDLFSVRNNYRFSTVATAGPYQNFTFQRLVAGNSFTVDLAAAMTIVNAPAWGTTGTAFVEVLNTWAGQFDVTARVTLGVSDRGSQRLYTRNGGATWTSEVMVTTTTAALSSLTSDVNTVNKISNLSAYNSTTGAIWTATGSSAAASWYLADGGASIFPV